MLEILNKYCLRLREKYKSMHFKISNLDDGVEVTVKFTDSTDLKKMQDWIDNFK